jgi:hypothetical protein
MNTISKLKWINLITKVNLLILCIIIQSKLLNMIDTVPDRWFSIWITGMVFCVLFTIFFVTWIAETIINWNRK